MNSYERFTARLRGQPVDRLPNFDIFMTRAAHHIGQPLSRYYLDHRVLVEANLAVLEAFDLDIVQAISDPYREASDLGLDIEELHVVIRDIPKPVIAAVNGWAIGGGNVLQVICDLTIAAETARFGQVGPRVGSVDPGFGTAYLARLVGAGD